MQPIRTASFVTTLALAAIAAGCAAMGGSSGGQRVMLTGQNEVPPVTTSAAGSATLTVGSDCSVKGSITVTGMSATAAHIHQAKAGVNGPVIVPFTKSGENAFAMPDGAKMNEAQCAAYKAGDTYMNVHSDKHKGGEVRGQIKGN